MRGVRQGEGELDGLADVEALAGGPDKVEGGGGDGEREGVGGDEDGGARVEGVGGVRGVVRAVARVERGERRLAPAAAAARGARVEEHERVHGDHDG